MALYETVFVTRQDLSEKQTKDLTEEMNKIIETNGGKVVNSEYWGLRTLAYQIKNNKKGHYTLFHIDGEPKAKDELERQLRQHDDILRFLSVRIDELPKEASPLMKGEAA